MNKHLLLHSWTADIFCFLFV